MLNISQIADIVSKIISLVIFVCLAKSFCLDIRILETLITTAMIWLARAYFVGMTVELMRP